MILGAHQSTAGGFAKAAERARDDTAESVQIFVKSPRTWQAKPLDPEQVELFRSQALAAYPASRWTIHAGYLINLASVRDDLRQKSIDALIDELNRGAALGIPSIVLHPGSYKDSDQPSAIARLAESINRIHGERGTDGPTILLENMAGAGSQLCAAPEAFADIFERLDNPDNVGVCLDTCHGFAAGLDWRTRDGYEAAIGRFAAVFDLDKVKVWHLNDSRGDCGSNLDRHEEIGEGEIGQDLFGWLVRDPRWQDALGILEVPVGDDEQTYRRNLDILKHLRDNTA